MKYFLLILIGLIYVLFFNKSKKNSKEVIIETTKGDIFLKLETTKAPITSKNFLNLIKNKFYDGLTFHRVVHNFVIQGGDPKGNGTGGSKNKIPLEIPCKNSKTIIGKLAPKDCEPLLPHKKGAVAMARNANPNSASSQFYITLEAQPYLDKKYSVFAYVTKGMNVVKNIKINDKIIKITTNISKKKLIIQ